MISHPNKEMNKLSKENVGLSIMHAIVFEGRKRYHRSFVARIALLFAFP